MIESARSVANDGQKIAKFVAMIAKHCTDTKYAMHIICCLCPNQVFIILLDGLCGQCFLHAGFV